MRMRLRFNRRKLAHKILLLVLLAAGLPTRKAILTVITLPRPQGWSTVVEL